jgi:hypothetical protein
MNVYTVSLIENVAEGAAAIERAFPGDNKKITEDCWLVAGSGTALDICAQLGLPVGDNTAREVQEGEFTGMITLVGGYFGWAPMDIWEWISSKIAQPVPPRGLITAHPSAGLLKQ